MKKMIAAFAVLAATALNSSALILHTKVTQGDIEVWSITAPRSIKESLMPKPPWASCAGKRLCPRLPGRECIKQTNGVPVRLSPQLPDRTAA